MPLDSRIKHKLKRRALERFWRHAGLAGGLRLNDRSLTIDQASRAAYYFMDQATPPIPCKQRGELYDFDVHVHYGNDYLTDVKHEYVPMSWKPPGE